VTEPVPHPLRVRVFGGRAVHAARELTGDHITACDYYLSAGATNHWRPDGTAATCGKCIRVLNREFRQRQVEES
jgi:hypothetical protein